MTIPTNKLMYFCLDYGIAIFCFYSFPMVIFSWLSQSNRWLTINPCTLVAHLVKNPPAMWETGFDPWFGRSPGEGNGYPLQYSGLENSMDCIVHGVAKRWTWVSNFHFSLYLCIWQFHCPINLGKAFPGGSVIKKKKKICLQCRRHSFHPWVRKIPWKRKWQPTPVFLSGKSHGLDGGAWWATVHGVAKNRTPLKWLSSYPQVHRNIYTWTQYIKNVKSA